MAEAQGLQLQVIVQEAKEAETSEKLDIGSSSTIHKTRNYNRWIRMAIYTASILCGQSVALLLGRLYFVKGGNSKWMATLVQLVGFPILIPFYAYSPLHKPNLISVNTNSPRPSSTLALASTYISLGLLLVGDCYLYSVGLQYLPVSTYTLISASQLAFNALFSFFLNSQKFTPFIINSLVLLTISSILLVFQSESENPTGVSKIKYVIGFICTISASAGYGLWLSLTQLSFRKVIKKETFAAVMDMIIYQGIASSFIAIVGLLGSGDWKTLNREMEGYGLGKVSYVMTLFWTAIGWQVFTIGNVGLVFEVSSLFSNAISVLGLPIVPVLAVIFFHDKMDGIKAISMVLAIWGIASYVYQHYLDDRSSKTGDRESNGDGKASTPLEYVRE